MSTSRGTPRRLERPLRSVRGGENHEHAAAGRARVKTSQLHGATLVLLRHGESKGHAAGLLSGISDPGLSREGREAARRAGATLRRANLRPDRIWSSTLTRARDTAALAARAGDFTGTASATDVRLNERNYGAHNGRRKAELVEELGYEGYLRLRRDVDYTPPPMSDAQLEHLCAGRRCLAPALEHLSRAESLVDVTVRVSPFYRERLLPALALTCQAVLVVAHGDSLRALCSVIDDLSPAELRELRIPAAIPLIYRFDWLLRAEHRGGRYLQPLDHSAPSAQPHGTAGDPR